ncbi:hypothetical protein Ddye_023728 [Dipteronia dyeriana]|uniref:Uncharacterized protein n=1 Tax=Dipteronia dyeriana TaxID=168575 RepID=A0AAD9TUF3_9ROSI|nr:hypothetical protein Ddye_023728 [Dipteronia dyeriana]
MCLKIAMMKSGNGLRREMLVDPMKDKLIEPEEDPVNHEFIGIDGGGISQANEQERREARRVWTKEEEDVLLSILDEIVASGGCADCGSFKSGTHHKQLEGFRDKHFPLFKRLANIFGKYRATEKAAQTPDQQAADFDKGDNFGIEFKIPESFSPMLINQVNMTSMELKLHINLQVEKD